METTEQLFPWLELMDRPAFCAKGGAVIACNTAAQNRTVRVGVDINEIVTEQQDIYQNFSDGCLYLTITVGGLPCNASVNRTKDYDIFVLEQDSNADQLQALALAAQQLRIPLSNVMTVADHLLSDLDSKDAQTQQQVGQLQHGLFQLLRLISNMSDTGSYQKMPYTDMQLVNLTAVFREIIEKAQTVSERTGVILVYTEPDEVVLGLAESEKLERAVYNILSNALKFAPVGSTVEAKLSCNHNRLAFTVCNTCEEPLQEHPFWNRYRREPSIEDGRHGLGLGMTLIGAVAAAHGGTVLIDHPDSKSTRVTMTIAITKDNSNTVRSPIMRIGDYAGGRDKALLEFADFLPTDAYDKI